MRASTRVIVVLLVLVAVVVAADRVSAYVAGRGVASEMASAQNLGGPADVTFSGFPFLTQAVHGRYRDVEVVLHRYPTSSGLVVDRIDAHLHGVSVPLGDVVRRRRTTLPVDRADATALVTFADLQTAARRLTGGLPITLTLARASDDRVEVGGTMTTVLGSFAVRGQAALAVSSGTVSVSLLPDTITGVPSLLRAQIVNLIDLKSLVPALPFGLAVTAATVTDSGLRISAAGTHLSIPG